MNNLDCMGSSEWKAPLSPSLIVGATAFEPGLPGISGIRLNAAANEPRLVAVNVDLEGLTPLIARRSLAWVHSRLERGEAFLIDEHEEEIELIRDPARIARILCALREHEARGYAMSVNEPLSLPRQATPVRMSRDGTLLFASTSARDWSYPLDLQLEGFHSAYQIRWSESGDAPTSVVRIRRRRHRRSPAPRRLNVRFTHPLWPGIHIDASVRDLALEGISFESDPVLCLLYPGLLVRNVELEWKGGNCIICDAVVRHVTQRPVTNTSRIGLQLTLADEQRQNWYSAVSGLQHPRVHRNPPEADALWKAYTKSGYFNLSGKSPKDFAPLHRAFKKAHADLCRTETIGASFAMEADRRVEAVAHQVSPWRGSFLFYQFCRHQTDRPLSVASDDALLELYAHAYEYLAERADARWLVTYVQTSARFSRYVFATFAERYVAQGRATMWQFRALEVSSSWDEGCGEYEIDTPTKAETSRLVLKIRRSRPRMLIQATGLSPLDQRATLRDWERAGMDRKRLVLVARREGRAVAAAVLDAAQTGLHLFSLMDCVRLFPLQPAGADTYLDLLRECAKIFSAMGKESFVYFCCDAEDTASRRHFRDLGTADTVVLPVQLVPELIEHVFELTGWESAKNSRLSWPPIGG